MTKFLCVFIAIFLMACASNDELEAEISRIQVSTQIDRFDKKFATASRADLPQLKKQYPYLFPEQFHDSVWVLRMHDTLQQEIYKEIDEKFADFEKDTMSIHSVFQHIKYYFKNFSPPKIVTVISDVDYKNRVIYTDTLMLIGLDNYLGMDHRFYGGIQQYIKQNFEPGQVPVDVARTIARSLVGMQNSRTLLAKMIYYGKLYYLMKLWMPNTPDQTLIGYTEKELAWTKSNQSYMWRYFIERELLFSTDAKLDDRFINPAPFSKFYLELDNESPGRLGQYIGWQIVNAYMQNNEVSLQQMLSASAEEIFNASKYKPEK